jgi:Uma2 family endonuclease
MSTVLRKPMTLDDFLAWEARQELRYEFGGFGPVARTGGTSAHATIQGNLLFALHGRLRGGPCRAYGSDLKIAVAGAIRYPDAFVHCSPLADAATVADLPVVVFEVLSPSTSRTDRIVKAREYGATPSIQRYVILEQTAQAATVFTRETGRWAAEVVVGDVDLPMSEIGISVPLAELYLDVAFPPRTRKRDSPHHVKPRYDFRTRSSASNVSYGPSSTTCPVSST